MKLKESPAIVADRLIHYMNDVDETKEYNLHMNADALVIEYNCKFTGKKCYDKIAAVENNS